MKLFTRDRSFYRTFFPLLLVITAQSLISLAVNLADNVMLGLFSETALAGAAIVNQLHFMLSQVVAGIGAGVVVLGAQYWGKGEAEPIRRIMSLGMKLSLVFGFRFSPKSGTLLENSVYNELANADYDEIYFSRKSNECDFIAKKGDKYHAFQVCYELNPLNRERELNGFRTLEKELKLSSRNIITYDTETKMGDIKVIPFWKFFGI